MRRRAAQRPGGWDGMVDLMVVVGGVDGGFSEFVFVFFDFSCCKKKGLGNGCKMIEMICLAFLTDEMICLMAR